MTQNISILGSTGSIGQSCLDFVRLHSQEFKILGLSAGSNLDVLISQIQEFHPQFVSVKNQNDANRLDQQCRQLGWNLEIFHGEEGAKRVASIDDVSLVVSAIVGAAGLLPTLEALKFGKTVALANKESMVIAGELMHQAAQKGQIIPVDSEHSAIFQCLQGSRTQDVKRLILTASGGPFLKRSRKSFDRITLAEALRHPNWDMGPKITIDSATMMNKGLELMEARWLFDFPVEKIAICVHPQSIIHSMVEYNDGAVMAQMGSPDMKQPIAYALSYPKRLETKVKPLNLFEVGSLNFYEPDLEKFPCLRLAYEVASKGQTYPAVLNAANEVAVELFLKEKISFMDIPRSIEKVLADHQPLPANELANILQADCWAREQVLRYCFEH